MKGVWSQQGSPASPSPASLNSTTASVASASSPDSSCFEWIQDYFCPVVGVLASPEVEELCRKKNNLAFVEVLQPFSKLLQEVTVKDPQGINHSVASLNVTFQNFRKSSSQQAGSSGAAGSSSSASSSSAHTISQRFISDAVAHVATLSGNDDDDDQTLPGTCWGSFAASETQQHQVPAPWFEVWTKLTLASMPPAEHEFLRNQLGCVIAASVPGGNGSTSGQQDPIEAFRAMTSQVLASTAVPNAFGAGGLHNSPVITSHHHHHQQQQQQQQHNSLLRFYVLVYDACEVAESTAQETFARVQSAFGSSFCHLLPIHAGGATTSGNDVADCWLNHLTATIRFCNVETRLASVVGENTRKTSSADQSLVAVASSNRNHSAENETNEEQLDHPLATADLDMGDFQIHQHQPTSSSSSSLQSTRLEPATATNTAQCLTSTDVDTICIFVREFVVKGLLPHLERMLRMLQDSFANRKGRSFFGGAKRWFGSQNKSGASSGTSVIYGKDAPELQVRKLGDLYFMLKLYKQAYNCFHTAKRDFQNDEAWNYYAGAAEMAALSLFMQGVPAKKYPTHYMEDSITKYLSVCQMPEFAVRATLFDAMCLRHHKMFSEAATSYIRMTSEGGKDLRSPLLLEQAAYCFLQCSPPLVRKYAFHIILAGYRFAKSGQKEHSSRAYCQGFRVYKGQGWSLSEVHILYSLGHQSLLLKKHIKASSLFNDLLAMDNPCVNPVQQMCHLREFFIVQHLREKEDKRVADITIPKFHPQECVLDLSDSDGPPPSAAAEDVGENRCRRPDSRSYASIVDSNPGSSWQDVEKVILEKLKGQEILFMSKTCQDVFGPHSRNSLTPQAVVGEKVRLLLPTSNLFQTPLLLKKVHLLWKYEGRDAGGSAVPVLSENLPKEEISQYASSGVVDSLLIEKQSKVVLEIYLVPKKPGRFTILGLEYSVKAQFPLSESTDHAIRGRQPLQVQGPRLNSTKEHKTKVIYGPDNRLVFSAVEKMPKLAVKLDFPEVMFQGEMRKLELVLENVGSAEVSKLFLVSKLPGLLSLGRRSSSVGGCYSTEESKSGHQKQFFSFPVINHPLLSEPLEDGSTHQVSLDILPVCSVDMGSKLSPGKSLKVPLWLRAPSSLGDHSLELLIYYDTNRTTTVSTTPSEIAGKGPKESTGGGGVCDYRIKASSFKVRVLPAVAVTARKVSNYLHENGIDSSVLVEVSNQGYYAHGAKPVGGGPSSGGGQGLLDSVSVTHIGLMSPSGLSLSELMSSGISKVSDKGRQEDNSSWTIPRGHSSCYCFKTAAAKDCWSDFSSTEAAAMQHKKPSSSSSSSSSVTISHIYQSSDKDGADRRNLGGLDEASSLASPPYVDFAKAEFSFENSAAKKLPTLSRDVIAVFWLAIHQGQRVEGLVHAPLLMASSSSSSLCNSDLSFRGTADVPDSTTTVIEFPLARPRKPCRVVVEAESKIFHNFSSDQDGPGQTLMVPFSISVENIAEEPFMYFHKVEKFLRNKAGTVGRNRVMMADHSSSVVGSSRHAVVGCTRTRVRMEPGSKRRFSFHVVIAAPGIYCFDNLHFQTSDPKDGIKASLNWIEDNNDDDEMVPLEISFVVLAPRTG